MAAGESLIILSSIASGANTLREQLITPKYAGTLVVPELVTLGYEGIENDLHTSRDINWIPESDFNRRVENGEFGVVWARQKVDFGPVKVIKHAYPMVPDSDPRLRVYFSNTSLLKSVQPSVEAFVDQARIAELTAQWEVRWQRLREAGFSEERVRRIMKWHEQNDDLKPMGYRPPAGKGLIDTTYAKGDPDYVRREFEELLVDVLYNPKNDEQDPEQLDLFEDGLDPADAS